MLKLGRNLPLNEVTVGTEYKVLHETEHHIVVHVTDITANTISGTLVTDQNNCMAYNDNGVFLDKPLSRGNTIEFDQSGVVSIREWPCLHTA